MPDNISTWFRMGSCFDGRMLVMNRKSILMLPLASRSFLRPATFLDPSASSTMHQSAHEELRWSSKHTNVERGKAVVLTVPLPVLLEADAPLVVPFSLVQFVGRV